nr:MAG TPA: hypothetical protein [Caudoviricetes sp.]
METDGRGVIIQACKISNAHTAAVGELFLYK